MKSKFKGLTLEINTSTEIRCVIVLLHILHHKSGSSSKGLVLPNVGGNGTIQKVVRS